MTGLCGGLRLLGHSTPTDDPLGCLDEWAFFSGIFFRTFPARDANLPLDAVAASPSPLSILRHVCRRLAPGAQGHLSLVATDRVNSLHITFLLGSFGTLVARVLLFALVALAASYSPPFPSAVSVCVWAVTLQRSMRRCPNRHDASGPRADSTAPKRGLLRVCMTTGAKATGPDGSREEPLRLGVRPRRARRARRGACARRATGAASLAGAPVLRSLATGRAASHGDGRRGARSERAEERRAGGALPRLPPDESVGGGVVSG